MELNSTHRLQFPIVALCVLIQWAHGKSLKTYSFNNKNIYIHILLIIFHCKQNSGANKYIQVLQVEKIHNVTCSHAGFKENFYPCMEIKQFLLRVNVFWCRIASISTTWKQTYIFKDDKLTNKNLDFFIIRPKFQKNVKLTYLIVTESKLVFVLY